jgi:hypothetical protein
MLNFFLKYFSGIKNIFRIFAAISKVHGVEHLKGHKRL